MSRSLKSALLLLVIFLLVVTLLVPGSMPSGAASAPSRYARVPAEVAGRLGSLGLHPRLELDYGSFRWLELSNPDFTALAASGIPYQEDRLAGQVRVMDFVFDPLAGGEPALPPAQRGEAGETGLRLVQLAGPLRDDWLAQLDKTGVTILQYYPSYTLLVWATPEQIERAAGLSAVRWSGLFHPAYRLSPSLGKLQGRIHNVAVTLYNDGRLADTLAQITALGGGYIQHFPAQPDRRFFTAIFSLEAASLEAVARLAPVWALEYSAPAPAFDDENGDQILAGNTPGGVPTTGYYDWLAANGVDGTGITWAVVDSGLDSTHPDITGRVSAWIGYTGAPDPHTDSDGHGSHTAGILFGDSRSAQGGTGIQDTNGFYWGAGVAPRAQLVIQNALMGSYWPPDGGWQVLSKDSLLNGATGSSNSWYTGVSGAQGYSAAARTHDLMVRDGNFETESVAEPIIMVFSAGNSGPSATTITEPKEAKNLIVVGASANYPRASTSINNIAGFSSRGPAVDGRLLPNVLAPGSSVTSFKSSTGTESCIEPVPGAGETYYSSCSGTSMAAPFVSGAAALITEWWDEAGRGTPSPAMVKALLINGAVDMVGGDGGGSGLVTNIPNNNQGWGRANLGNVIANGASMVYRDQGDLLFNTGETISFPVDVINPALPLKVTLVWSDAAAAINASPALVNNLDLRVVSGGNTYLGNRFSSGWSITGGSPDELNNIENVYLQSPGTSATITIQAVNLAGDGVPYNSDPTDQDFALVCYNCQISESFTLAVTPATQSTCAPANTVYTVDVTGYLGFSEPVTLSASGQPVGTTATFAPNPVTPTGSSTLTIGNTGAAAGGSYTIQITGEAASDTQSETARLDLYTALPSPPVLLSPSNGAINQPLPPLLTWQALPGEYSYTVEVATDSAFSNIVATASELTGTSYSPTSLSANTLYYWRVRTANPCGTVNSQYFSFVTQLELATCRSLNLSIPDGSPSGVSDSQIDPGSFAIDDLNVTLKTTHSWIGDLVYTLEHNGASATLIDRPGVPGSTYGCGQNHINARLDDEASAPVENQCQTSGNSAPPPYAIDGTFTPNNPLSVFDGHSLTGEWKLTVADMLSGDSGKLTEWCLSASTQPADYSDLNGSYGVAWHTGSGILRLGSGWSADSSASEGSDNSGDDGVTRMERWLPGANTTLKVNASGSGWIAGWVDWNANGQFENPGEMVADTPVSAGNTNVLIPVPVSYVTGTAVRVRFRLYHSAPAAPESAARPTGGADNGEAEDYVWSFTPTAVQVASLSARAVANPWLWLLGVAGAGLALAGIGARRKRA